MKQEWITLSLVVLALMALRWPLVTPSNNLEGRNLRNNGFYQANNHETHYDPVDVCILGAGAGGMSTAVFLRDKGYSVRVFEPNNHIGGQCDTIYFVPLQPGLPNWEDIGVVVFANTTDAEAKNFGQWAISSQAIVERFAGGQSAVLPIPFGETYSCVVDFGDHGQNHSCSKGSSDDIGEEIVDLIYLIQTRYPWASTASVPAPVPEELLQPTIDFILQNNLTEIYFDFLISLFVGGGFPDINTLPALYFVLNVSPVILNVFLPGGGFSVREGCNAIYEGMTQYIRSDHISGIVTNAQIEHVSRPPGKCDYDHCCHRRVIITGFEKNPEGYEWPFYQTCKKVVVAYPPTLEAMADFHLDKREHNLLKTVRRRYYYTGTFNANVTLSPADLVAGFSITNVNISTLLYVPSQPSVMQVSRNLPYGPVQFKFSSANYLSAETVKEIASQQLAFIPADILTNVTDVKVYPHDFAPYFTDEELANPDGGLTALAELQGYRDTFYVGALASFAATFNIWDHSYLLVDQHF